MGKANSFECHDGHLREHLVEQVCGGGLAKVKRLLTGLSLLKHEGNLKFMPCAVEARASKAAGAVLCKAAPARAPVENMSLPTHGGAF